MLKYENQFRQMQVFKGNLIGAKREQGNSPGFPIPEILRN